MFSKFDNFWYKDGQDDEIMQGALHFSPHLIYFNALPCET